MLIWKNAFIAKKQAKKFTDVDVVMITAWNATHTFSLKDFLEKRFAIMQKIVFPKNI